MFIEKKQAPLNKSHPSVQLALNGKPIYLNNILISVSLRREEKDMSGQKSSTKKSDKGVKAKALSVSGLIPYNRREWLTALFKLAEAEDSKGEQEKYRVSCVTAETVNMREVQFSDTISAQELQDKLAWQVSFTLREINSIAEKKEQRKTKPKAKVQSENAAKAEATAPSENSASATNSTPQAEEDNSFWGQLDKALA
ncbi:MAG: hypothetical protein SOX56_08275 [[Pasteurella] mairii]|uniref:Uncharacterized protein n=1 Tax=[Pasteurella] mairii TaxID=757 RepID=A0A379B5K4_9PAST|nr:hypothetical protein [[Pasteurella] mairii]SUB33772.1 Uncharacterised protein [[Pasteurella] mairii]